MNKPIPSRARGSFIERLEDRIALTAFIFAAGRGVVNIFADNDQNGTFETQTASFTPFPGYKGALSLATGDFDGDGNVELVTAKASGRLAGVQVWDVGGGGSVTGLIDSFVPFTGKSRGVSVAAADLDNDGADELLVGSGPGAPSSIQIYTDSDRDGVLSEEQTDAFAPFPANFLGGVRLAAGDIRDDAKDEVVAGHWSRGGLARIFADANGNRAISDNLPAVEEIAAFGTKYRAGVTLAVGPISGAGGSGAEVLIGKRVGPPSLQIFTDSNANGAVSDDPLFDALTPALLGFRSGVNVAVGDTDNSGSLVEVITAPGGGRGGTIRVFDDNGDAGFLLSDNEVDDAFAAFAATHSGGIQIAFGKTLRETFARTGPMSIPDNGALNDPLTVSLFVPMSAGIIRDLDVHLSIQHPFNADLDVTLLHVPSGISLTLFTDVGSNDDGFFIRLDDESATDIGAVADDPDDRPIIGSFRPEGSALLSIFDGLDASGEWRLTIDDDLGAFTGTFLSWILDIDYD